MTNQQGAPEARSYEHQRAIMEGERNASLDAYSRVVYLTQTESRIYEAGFTNGWNRLAALVEAQQPAKAESLRQILTDPENQPNQYGVQFLMHGPKMAFKIGARQFTLDYEPTEPGEFEFMRDALIDAFSIFTPDVKMARQPTQSAAVALSDDLRDRLVAISEAIADQDDRAAQAMLREILAAPQPSPTPQADSQPAPVLDREAVIRAAVAAMPHTNPMVAGDLLGGFTMHTEADDVIAIFEAGRAASAPTDSVLEDAARWQALPAFFEEYQIDAMKLYRDIDAYLAAARKQGGAT